MKTYKIRVEGTVQGVGFRPFIYRLATEYGIYGSIINGANGVEITVNASEPTVKKLITSIYDELPPLAKIDKLSIEEISYINFDNFSIDSTNSDGDVTVRVPPDVSICYECRSELFDPTNRRYRYPFITCTNCGVRYSIIYDLPYDRPNTSMRFFEMCDVCREEYSNPIDRRYHAQPIGCWECGPTLSLWDNSEKLVLRQAQELGRNEELVDVASQLLLDGKIVAVKGVGGYHLMCDATNEEAVTKLRERKRRPAKPFAVMVKDMAMAHRLAIINDQEEMLLCSKERPIVLLRSKSDNLGISMQIAPNISRIGLFLPYTPLHLLLLDRLDRPLVATSANITDEPICTDIKSLSKLNSVYDYVLEHDRKIVNGCDDSVVMVVKGQQIIIRRARGYAPASVKLPFRLDRSVLAVGANQKSTVAIGFNDQAILSPHIGDLDSIGSVAYYKKNIETLKRMYRFEPEAIVHDMHPQYESTKVALRQAQGTGAELVEVQHHYAHILGVMAEKQIDGKVFGVAFDGTGYGSDGKLWGGEFMICDYSRYERVAHLNYFKLLGGERAVKEPKRVALSLLFDLYGKDALKLDIPTINAFNETELNAYYLMWQKGLNSPLSSSAGRLFDAVSSLLGVCQVMSFEGESGMLMEELYDDSVKGNYSFIYQDGYIDILPMIEQILQEKSMVVAVSKFFNTLVEMIANVYLKYNSYPLVLSGGVFQNRVLLELVLAKFPDALIPNDFPPNDGGIALGQLVNMVSDRVL